VDIFFRYQSFSVLQPLAILPGDLALVCDWCHSWWGCKNSPTAALLQLLSLLQRTKVCFIAQQLRALPLALFA